MKAEGQITSLRVPDGEADLRLGWLESFVASAALVDYKLAAIELGIDQTNVKRNVQSLELWLRRPLLDDDGAIEITCYGLEFFDVATDVLRRINDVSDKSVARIYETDLARNRTSNLHMSDMKTILHVARCKTYKRSKNNSGLSESQIRKKVAAVEHALGVKIFEGGPVMNISRAGQLVVDQFSAIVQDLEKARAVISDPADMNRQRIHWLRIRTELQLVKLKHGVEVLNGRKRLQPAAVADRTSAIDNISKLEALLEIVVEAQEKIGMPRGWIDPKSIVVPEDDEA